MSKFATKRHFPGSKRLNQQGFTMMEIVAAAGLLAVLATVITQQTSSRVRMAATIDHEQTALEARRSIRELFSCTKTLQTGPLICDSEHLVKLLRSDGGVLVSDSQPYTQLTPYVQLKATCNNSGDVHVFYSLLNAPEKYWKDLFDQIPLYCWSDLSPVGGGPAGGGGAGSPAVGPSQCLNTPPAPDFSEPVGACKSCALSSPITEIPVSTEADLLAMTSLHAYKLTNDIAISGAWPVPPAAPLYNFRFNGNGHTISNLPHPLFGGLSQADILNLTLKDAVIVDPDPAGNLGALASSLAGDVSVFDVTVSNPTVTAGSTAGGLAGTVAGIATNTANFVRINIIGGKIAGMIAGGVFGQMLGVVDATDINLSTSVVGKEFAGGLAGLSNGGFTDYFQNIRTSSSVTSGEMVGGFLGIVNGTCSYFSGSVSSGAEIIDRAYAPPGYSICLTAGGFVGYMNGTSFVAHASTNSSSVTTVISCPQGAGGFVGGTNGGQVLLDGSTNSGTVTAPGLSKTSGWGAPAGGFIATMNGTKLWCNASQNTGAVTAQVAGWLAGWGGGVLEADTGCQNTGKVTAYCMAVDQTFGYPACP